MKTLAREKLVRFLGDLGFHPADESGSGLLFPVELHQSSDIDRSIKYRSVFDRAGAGAVFEVAGTPCVYFKEYAYTPTMNELMETQRIAWNHGLAPMFWIISPETITILNCFAKPSFDTPLKHDFIISTFDRTLEGLRKLREIASCQELESGRFWSRPEAASISRQSRVDASLLEDLSIAEGQLIDLGLDPETAHSLLGRSIFISYLIDRSILKQDFLQSQYRVSTLSEIFRSKDSTYDLFDWMRRTFNGDLFPVDIKREIATVKQKHLDRIYAFLSGEDMSSGQKRFWPYQFDVIPVELISSIYERFAHSKDQRQADEESVHYTPFQLVDFVLTQVFEKTNSNAKTLDLACGSGVFLVEAFRRLVTKRIQGGEEHTRGLVRDTLKHQIFGIDINPEAIRITAFSLYLTTLELDPEEQPSLSKLKFEQLRDRNLFIGNAFHDNELVRKHKFDVIVGNPPWTPPEDDKSAEEYCESVRWPMWRRAPDQAFLRRALDFAHNKTTVGLILHSRPFFSHAKAAIHVRNTIFSSFAPELIVNLSELRNEQLFQTSIEPALVFVATCHSSILNERFTYINVPWSGSFRRTGILEFSPENIKRMQPLNVIEDPLLLKVLSWGTLRDAALVRRLRKSHKALGEIANVRGWITGQGFIRGKPSERTRNASELVGKKILEADEVLPFEIHPGSFSIFKEPTLQWPRDVSIYTAPLLVIRKNQQLSSGQTRVRAALSRSDIVYSESYFGISVPKAEGYYARYLNGVLNSSLATYYLCLSAPGWGIYRDEIKPDDVRSMPLALPRMTNDPLVARLLNVEEALRHAKEPDEQDSLLSELDQCVAKIYELDEDERILVDDFLKYSVDLRLRLSKSNSLDLPSSRSLETYARQLQKQFVPFFKTLGERGTTIDILETKGAPLQVVCLMVKNGNDHVIRRSPRDDIQSVLSEINTLTKQRWGHQIYSRPFLRIYSDNSVFIIKPAQARYWTRTAALVDGDSIVGDILGGTSASD